MNLSDLKNLNLNSLDVNNIGSWPLPVRIGAVILVSLVVLGAGIWIDTRTQLAELDASKAKEEELKKTYEEKQAKVANLSIYKHQMVEMERTFGALLRQLPSKTEVSDLLLDVSGAGVINGLEFELFQPQQEVPNEFYAELPVKIKVTGSYHSLGRFVSDVSAMSRIVTLHDMSINIQADGTPLMETTAKTYRYLDEDEVAALEAKKKDAEKAKGK